MRFQIVAAALLATPAIADLPPISQLAGDRAIVVVEIDDFSEMIEAADRAGLKTVFEDEQVQRFIAAVAGRVDDEQANIDKLINALGVEREDLSWPEGRCGFAMSLPMQIDKFIESDAFQDEEYEYEIVMAVDLGEGAEVVRDAVEELVDLGLDKGFVEIEEDEKIAGARVVTLRSIVREQVTTAYAEYYAQYEERSEAAQSDEDYEALWEWMENNSPKTPFDDLAGADEVAANLFYASSEFSYTWIDDTFVFASRGEAMLDMLDAMEDGRDDAASETDFYNDALDGLNDDAHMRIAVDLDAFFEMAIAQAQMLADEFDPMASMSELGFSLLGMRDMRAFGLAVSMDTPQVAEVRARLVADEKVGWMRLVDLDETPLVAPAFVPADVASLAVIRADFSRLIDIVEQVAEALPGNEGEMVRAQLNQAMFIARPIVESLGDSVLIWGTQADPEELQQNAMAGTVIAVPLDDPAPLRNAMAGFAPMLQLEPREFLGAQIYEGDLVPMSLGLGNNWLVIGTQSSVEDTLRLTSDARDAGLASTDDYRNTLGTLSSDRGVALIYQNAERYFKQLYAAADAYEDQQEEWWGDDWDEFRPGWLDEIPDIEIAMEHVGSAVGVIRATDDGFEMQVVVTKPE